MICNKCNNEINPNDIFCGKCGKKVNIENNQTEFNNINVYKTNPQNINVAQPQPSIQNPQFFEQQNIQPNSTIIDEQLNSNNPNKTQEIIVQIGNFLLLIPLCYSMLSFFLNTIRKFFLGMDNSLTGSDHNLKQINIEITNMLIIFIITMLLIIAFNIIMGMLMYKKNKEKQYIGKYKMVKKITYVLLAYFLGIYGIHRFIIGDNKGGAIRLTLTFVVPFVIQILSRMFGSNIIEEIFFYLIFICTVFIYSLSISDFVIGLSKVSNGNKMISI